MIVIAGRTVALNDVLYDTKFKAWGTVVGFDVGAAKLSIVGGNGVPRIIYVQAGGLVNGTRTVYWHEPLVLDLPVQNITKYQNVLNAIIAEFGS
jgi:hypothetical protein